MPRRSNELGSTRVSFWRDCAVNENSRVVKEKPTPFQRYAQLFQTLPDPQQRDISEELIQYTLDDECYQRYVEKMVHLLEAFATFGQYQFFQAEVIVSVALVEAGSLPDSATVAGKFKSWLEFIRTSCGFDHQQREQGEKSAYHTMVSYIFLFLNDPRLKSVASMETTYFRQNALTGNLSEDATTLSTDGRGRKGFIDIGSGVFIPYEPVDGSEAFLSSDEGNPHWLDSDE